MQCTAMFFFNEKYCHDAQVITSLAKGNLLMIKSTSMWSCYQVATLAIYLGMIEEAKNLLETNADNRMLIKLLCDLNRWDEALELAERKSRINLKNTYFR